MAGKRGVGLAIGAEQLCGLSLPLILERMSGVVSITSAPGVLGGGDDLGGQRVRRALAEKRR